MKKVVIIGAGLAGATAASLLADNGYDVSIYEKRNHIGGNVYDYKDESNSFVHLYGPHIFHTNNEMVYNFLSKYTNWFLFEHKVLGQINGQLVPIPFSLKSLEMIFSKDKAKSLKKKLIEKYGEGNKVTISELRKEKDKELNDLAEFIYENVFLHYTEKQWGISPEKLGNQVTGRVPIYISYDERYFQDKYQYMPTEGFTSLVKNMLDKPNICLHLNENPLSKIEVRNNKIYFEGNDDALIIYTGSLDEFFNKKYGILDYRTLKFEFETLKQDSFQPVGVVNYPNDYDYTRISEFKKFTVLNSSSNVTTITKEYPCKYEEGMIPYYPIPLLECEEKYKKYRQEADKIINLKLIGRLAEYKYYNMDLVIQSAIDLVNELLKGEK